MLLTEYNPRKHLKLEREEARKEGREEGIRALILENLEDGTTPEKICEKLERYFELTKEQSSNYINQYTR